MIRTTTNLIQFIAVLIFLISVANSSGSGIEFTNGRVAMLSSLLFISPEQEKKANKSKVITLTPEQSRYLAIASRLDHCTQTVISNLKILSQEEAMKADVKSLLNVAVRNSNDSIDIPYCFLGSDLAERDKLRKTTLYTETSSSTLDEVVNEDRKTQWFDFRMRITERLCQFYALHPERFKYIGNDAEIEIDGFADFVSKDQICQLTCGGYQVHNGKIYDSWGEPLHFVKNRNGNRFIIARGFKNIISMQPVYGPERCKNEKEQLGICKHSSKGFEDAPYNCIYVEVYSEPEWWKQKRLQQTNKKN